MKIKTALDIKRAPQGRHNAGRNLYLIVDENGARRWEGKIVHDKVAHYPGFGSAFDITLSEAREAVQECRRAYRRGEDPIAEKRKARKLSERPTFRAAAEALHAEHSDAWKNEKHRAQWLSSIEKHVFPKIGAVRIDRVDEASIGDVLAPLWVSLHDTAKRLRQRIVSVLDFAKSKGWRDEGVDLATLNSRFPKIDLAASNHAAMEWDVLPAFLHDLRCDDSIAEPVRLALEFAILTAGRSGEVRGAALSEMELERDPSWTIPAARMKAGREHRVPLTPRMVDIFKRMLELRTTNDPDALLFPGNRPGKPYSDITLAAPLKAHGCTVHGMRATFRTWAGECTSFPRELAEVALAHAVGNRTEKAYNRGDLFNRRRDLMEAWERHCCGAENVVTLAASTG